MEWRRSGADMKNMRMRVVVLLAVFSLWAINASGEIWRWTYIPHVAVGSGYTSYLTIREPHGTATRWVYVYFHSDSGQSLPLNVEGVGTVTDFSFQLAPFQEKSFALTGTSFAAGSIQIAAQGIGDLSASLRFATVDGAGNLVDVVGILPAVPNWEWTLTVEKRKPADDTGVAIANPWSATMRGYSELLQGVNRVPGTAPVPWTLNPDGHYAAFVSQIFPNASFSGAATLKVYSTADTFTAVALRADGLQYSSLPLDAGVQFWNVSYTDSGSQVSVSWAWRFNDGYSFMGYEQNPFNSNAVRLRGVMASDYSSFVAEWNYANNDGTKGMVLFQGVPGKEGNTDVINGTRTQIDKDGVVVSKVPFKATRFS
jgi:hypothetical protein